MVLWWILTLLTTPIHFRIRSIYPLKLTQPYPWCISDEISRNTDAARSQLVLLWQTCTASTAAGNAIYKLLSPRGVGVLSIKSWQRSSVGCVFQAIFLAGFRIPRCTWPGSSFESVSQLYTPSPHPRPFVALPTGRYIKTYDPSELGGRILFFISAIKKKIHVGERLPDSIYQN